MDQFNKDTYKKRGLAHDFTHSCLGKIIITAAVLLVLSLVAIISVPREKAALKETDDNIRQCLQDNDSIKGDVIDDVVSNIARTFTKADSTLDKKDRVAIYRKHNKLEYYNHTLFSTVRIRNNARPEGVRASIGVFGIVISTILYEDLLMDVVPVRGNYNEPLIKESTIPDPYIGENPYVKPYHYQGNPDN